MPRAKNPDGRHVTLATRVTAATARAIDAERGTATRSEWLEALIYAALADGVPRKVTRQRPGGRTAPLALPPPPEVVEEAIVPLNGESKRAWKPAARQRVPEPPREPWQPPFIEPVMAGEEQKPSCTCRAPSAQDDGTCGYCGLEID